MNKQAYSVYKQAGQPVRAIFLLSSPPEVLINLVKVASVLPCGAGSFTLLTSSFGLSTLLTCGAGALTLLTCTFQLESIISLLIHTTVLEAAFEQYKMLIHKI